MREETGAGNDGKETDGGETFSFPSCFASYIFFIRNNEGWSHILPQVSNPSV